MLEFHVDPSGVGFDLVVNVPIMVSEEQRKISSNMNNSGWNDSVDLDHPNVCPASHLGGSSSFGSEP